MFSPLCHWPPLDADRAQKHGMDEFISANPCSFDHASLFEMVQRLTLDHRLNDTFCCLVSCARDRLEPRRAGGWVGFGDTVPSSVLVWLCAGLVQPGPGVCLGWVLRQERRAGLSQTPVLPAWPPGEGGERGHYRPHPSSLQLCFLRLPCAWEQVWPNPLFFFTSMCRRVQWQPPLNASVCFGSSRMSMSM